MKYEDKVRRIGDAVFYVAYTIEGFDLPNMTEAKARDFAQTIAARAESLFRDRFPQEEEER